MLALLVVASIAAWCAAFASSAPRRSGAATPSVAVTQSARIDRLTSVASLTYAREMDGAVARADLRQIAQDAGLRAAARSGSDAAVRSYVSAKFPVWFHEHVSRLQILRGARVVADQGVPFVVDGPHTTLPGGSGSKLTLRISIQDEIGFVRLLHRHHPIDVVVRGRGRGHVRTSLPAALHVHLPDSGAVTIAGRRYQVRTLSRTALGGEPVKIWILAGG
jgi:hypothetical protein